MLRVAVRTKKELLEEINATIRRFLVGLTHLSKDAVPCFSLVTRDIPLRVEQLRVFEPSRFVNVPCELQGKSFSLISGYRFTGSAGDEEIVFEEFELYESDIRWWHLFAVDGVVVLVISPEMRRWMRPDPITFYGVHG